MPNNFDKEYRKLNPEQKLAVDTIDGPVMVVAGAGTGKTQTIALRIAKILLETQINPSNILCLTFTDNAAINMRRRLLSIIGPEAYSVRIGTFHAFCQSVIRANPEHFLQFHSDSEPLDKIEQIQIIRELIDGLPSDSPLKSPVDTYFSQGNLIWAIESLKKENINPDQFSDLVNQSEEFIDLTQTFYQQLKDLRADKKNLSKVIDIVQKIIDHPDLNQTYKTKISSLIKDKIDSAKDTKASFIGFYESCQKSLTKQQALTQVYPQYQSALLARHRFDFNDMILSVIDTFRSRPELLSSYQEKYQYLLVDEYQDTNTSQNEIINLLISQNDSPNVFVVGDDDQSIFRFQGASTENVYNFYLQYRPKLVVLKNNYRSHRLILDSSQAVINRNLNRIATRIKEVDKTLIATRVLDPDPINLYQASTFLEENFWIAKKIRELIDSGTSPNEIAVLVRNNTDIDDLLPPLSRLKIKYVKDYGTDILLVSEILELIDLLRLLSNPEDTALFGKVLNFNFLKFPSLDLYRHFHHQDTTREFQKKLTKFKKRIAAFQKKKANYSPDRLFNRAIRRFGYLKWVLKNKNLELLKQFDRLYSEFKIKRPGVPLTFDQIVSRLSLYFEDKIALNSPPLLSQADSCIRLLTVHKAKGLEFEHVFLIKALTSRWEESRGGAKINLPLGITHFEVLSPEYDVELEDNRRLFYVALTRAKNQIYLTYTQNSPDGRELLPTRFISEIDPKLIETIKVDPTTEEAALLTQFQLSPSKLFSPPLADYLKFYFANNYRLNITHLNSYQKCPLCFFFKTILKIPQTKTKSLSFGTGVHATLAYLFNSLKKNDQLISLEKFIGIFEIILKKEALSPSDFADLLSRGKKQLTDYYQHYQAEFNPNCLIEHDFKSYSAHLEDIPITGKIDKIEIITGNRVNVVDFKTGNPDTKYAELKSNGDYFRQLVFYKILASCSSGFKYQVVSGTIDFIQKNSRDQFVRRNFDLAPEDVSTLTRLIKDTYRQITSFNFSSSPDCSDPDHLHHLADKYFQT